jgi:hypothetical protein
VAPTFRREQKNLPYKLLSIITWFYIVLANTGCERTGFLQLNIIYPFPQGIGNPTGFILGIGEQGDSTCATCELLLYPWQPICLPHTAEAGILILQDEFDKLIKVGILYSCEYCGRVNATKK